MAFGFLVERFDLLLEIAAPSITGRALWVPGQKLGNEAGLALLIFGTAIVALAATRFLRTAKIIDQRSSARHTAGSFGLCSFCLSVARVRCKGLKMPSRCGCWIN